MLGKELVNLIEAAFGSKISSSSDCERLAFDIEKTTGERLGATTLKRLLGFTAEKASPRQSTLEIMARYVGFNSCRELEDAIANKGDSLFYSSPDTIYSENLNSGDEITISYSPNRTLFLIHIERDEFEVRESKNGSLKMGDRVFIDSFTSGLPLLVKDVIRDGESLGRYIAGSQFGITVMH